MAKMTAMKAIRLKCLDCCVGDASEVRKCVCTTCSLHPYRFGKGPQEPVDLDQENYRGYNPRRQKSKPFAGGTYVKDSSV